MTSSASPRISVGLQITTQPPVGAVEATVGYAKLIRGLEPVMAVDHFPSALWVEHHYTLDGVRIDLAPQPGKSPTIWAAGHGPRTSS
jgi:hypothetical protein